MRYRISHSTRYQYSQSVGLCQNEARLRPRNYWRQHCDSCHFDINPAPVDFRERFDYFGNRAVYFAVQQPHSHMMVTATSEVTVFPNQSILDLIDPVSWEQVDSLLKETPWQGQSQNQDQINEIVGVKPYTLDSPMVTVTPELAKYAKSSFQPNRPLVEVVHDLMRRIYSDFTYDPAFTTIATPLSDVLNFRRGVCQDFAHLAIGCLRAYGIAARYVSGYVETVSEPGQPRLVGADASHAWFSIYIPGIGWMDFDPTNNTVPFCQHITLAWGRDYADVTPLKGIAFGGGQHTLSVSVDVERLD
ncbi:MAG: transglutaminase family protein [Gammaproteobacteria bacterium]